MTLTVADMPAVERVIDDDAPRTIRGTALGADCANCPFGKFGKPDQPVFGEGWERPNWIVVGEGPGQTEVVQNRPFVGASGRLVNEALSKIGVARESLFITNSMLCQPPHGATDHVKKLARQACGERLRRELHQFPGVPILALGAHAAQQLTGNEKFSITQMAGSYYQVDLAKTSRKPDEPDEDESAVALDTAPDVHDLIVSIHPAAILRGGSGSGGGGSHTVDLAFWNLLYDAQKVNLLSKGKDIKFTDDIQIELESWERAKQLVADFVADARRLGKFACDTETYVDNPKQHTALAPVNANLSALGLATVERAISIAWELCIPEVLEPLDALFADETITKIFHNRIYDVPVLERHGFVIKGPIHCTMLMHHSAFPGLAHSLQRVLTQFYVAPPWKCLRGDVAVLLPDRSTMPIEECVRKHVPNVLSVEDGQIVAKRVIGWHEVHVPNQKWLCVKTSRNDAKYTRGLIVTPDHRVMTQRGLVEAQHLKVGQDAIAIDEPNFSEDQIAVCIGTLLGDSSLNVSRTFHHRPWEASRASISGEHTNRGLSNYKVETLPLGTRGQTVPAHLRQNRERTWNASAGYPYGTKWAFQLMDLAPLIYDGAWNRRIKLEALQRMGRRGLATMYMDDGDLKRRDKITQRPSAGFATHGFPKTDIEVFAQWIRELYGAVSVYKGGYCALGVDATANMLEDLRGYIVPSMWYKTIFRDKLKPIKVGVGVHHLPIKSVTLACADRSTSRKRKLNDHRYCLSVEDTKLFFTNYGLVSNSEYRHGQGTLAELLPYCARDTLATARIEAPISVVIKRSQAEKTYEVDLAMAHAASVMHVKGVPIDKEVNEQLRTGFRSHIGKAKQELLDKIQQPGILPRFKERLAFEQARRTRKHDPLDLDQRIAKRLDDIERAPFNFMIDSGDHIVAFLKACGVPLSLQTASGRISTKKDVLEAFVQYPEVRALLSYRENAKLLSTFCERMFDRALPNGKTLYGFADPWLRVHPRWSVHAITGRWRSEGPQAQNWPKADKKKGRPNLRSQVVAPRGRAFVAFDAKQLEARLIALMSGDPFLLDIFHQDKDIHSEFARIVWPDFDTVPVDERKVRRDLIKRPEYGAFYAGSIETLWKSVVRDYPSVSIGMIDKMVRVMKTRMPGVTAWHQNMMRMADQQGEIRSMILGRRRCFPIKQFDLSEVVNFPIQSSGADLINLGLMEIMKLLPEDAFPILQIHDAVVFECDEDDQDLVKALVVKCFTREVEYNGNKMNFPVDAKSGKTWAEVN